MSMDFLTNMRRFIDEHKLLQSGQGVVVGLSGGADSVALTAALRELGCYRLVAVHVHHGLRDQAQADADFCRELAGQWQIPFRLEYADIAALAAQSGLGVEEAARGKRYELFAAHARAEGASAVAVAHHADDQVETVLHRLFRGTHLRGLSGMRPSRGLAEGIALVRPMLWARRSEVEAFCRQQGLTWQSDHTNAELDYTRNFIRHSVLPMLRERLNAKVDESVLRASASAASAEDALAALAQELFERSCRKASPNEVSLRVAPLRKAPPLLASMALRKALATLNAPQRDLSQDRYEDLLAVLDGRLKSADLPGAVHAAGDGKHLRLWR